MSQAYTQGLVLRLYVAGENSPNSSLAISNVRAALGERISVLEIVDVLAAPERALEDGIVATPTLTRVAPRPERTIVGTLVPHQLVIKLLEF